MLCYFAGTLVVTPGTHDEVVVHSQVHELQAIVARNNGNFGLCQVVYRGWIDAVASPTFDLNWLGSFLL